MSTPFSGNDTGTNTSGSGSADEVTLDPERRAALEEERDFLLRSLSDLDTEYQAGDLDDHDYKVLRDGYTARAADVLREIERGSEPVSHIRLRPKRIAITALVTVGVFAAVWWGLSTFSAQRLPDQSMTGLDPRSQREQMLSQARQAQFERPAEAAAIYQLVLQEYPADVEAMTYGGWTRALAIVRTDSPAGTKARELTGAAEMLTEAIHLDPTYADPRCLRGVLYGRFLERPALATEDLDICLELNPPSDMRGLIEGLILDLQDDVASATTAP